MFDRFVAFRARLHPAAPAVITLARTFSFAELDADVNRLAAGLRDLGVTPASGAVAIQATDAYHQIILLLALARLRVVSTVAYDARADLRLSDEAGGEGPPGLHLTRQWFAAAFAAEATAVTPPAVQADDVGRVLMSSGTTRTPRRVGLTWRMIEANIRNAAVTFCAGKAGRWITLTGLDSMMGTIMTLTAWATGATVAVGWPVEDLPAGLEAWQPTLLGFTPSHLRTLLQRMPPDSRPQPGLRLIVGGSILPRALAQEARARLTPDLQIIYGSTECSAMAHADAGLLDATPGATGYPGPGVRVDILDAEGAPVAAGEPGEVRISCDRAARGYIDDPEASAQAFRGGGFHPGDIGRVLPDGLLVIEGRVDERMNLGGRKVMPGLVEGAALACPGVIDAAAFAAPDQTGFDQCWLAVVQGVGFQREQLVAQLAAHGEALPPVRFAWIAEIPRNAMGKVERARLREEAMAVLGVAPEA